MSGSTYASDVLQPVLHSRPHEMSRDAVAAFDHMRLEAKQVAPALAAHLDARDVLWLNDYPLVALGQALRAYGCHVPLGFYHHAPFPAPDIISIIPSARKLLDLFLAYDCVGFQSADDLNNFAAWACVARDDVLRLCDQWLQVQARPIKLITKPVGIDFKAQRSLAERASEEVRIFQAAHRLRRHQLIIGYDGDLLNGGSLERLDGMEALLTEEPEHLRRISLLQIASLPEVSSREFGRWQAIAGRTANLCGRYATFGWNPVQLLGRPLDPGTVAGLYRGARVGLFTALAEGTSLEAKRFAASQDSRDPGVLILSRTSGAASELRGAVLVNPYDASSTANGLREALAMPVEERRMRHRQIVTSLHHNGLPDWLRTLATAMESKIPPVQSAELVGPGFLTAAE